jgi:UDP-N-acetylmuramyl pentapeptide phosphotransferase/UDP-N-acetylglucosamine-1-phosphate transferase
VLLVLVAAACFIATGIGVGIFVRWAARARLLDVPNARSSHRIPTPRGGGIVIVVVVAGAMIWAARSGLFEVGLPAVAALAIAGVSGIDDVRSLPSWLRLLVHAGCGAAAVGALAGSGDTGLWSPGILVLAVIWVVGLTNAYNFMDGIDGISAAQAIVAGSAIAVGSLRAGLAGDAIAGTALAAASAGFLLHNWTPARVFMGDVSSAFLGFSFAVLVLDIGRSSPRLGAAIVLSLWPFLFDTSFTLLRRAVRAENVLSSHRSHLYQRLVIAGWTHARVALTYAAASAVGWSAGFAWATGTMGRTVLLVVPLMALAIWIAVARSEAAARSRSSRPVDAGRVTGR